MSSCSCPERHRVFSGEFYACNPPRWFYICSECGAVGAQETEGRPALDYPEFWKQMLSWGHVKRPLESGSAGLNSVQCADCGVELNCHQREWRCHDPNDCADRVKDREKWRQNLPVVEAWQKRAGELQKQVTELQQRLAKYEEPDAV